MDGVSAASIEALLAGFILHPRTYDLLIYTKLYEPDVYVSVRVEVEAGRRVEFVEQRRSIHSALANLITNIDAELTKRTSTVDSPTETVADESLCALGRLLNHSGLTYVHVWGNAASADLCHGVAIALSDGTDIYTRGLGLAENLQKALAETRAKILF